jgi:DNA-binding CsgD family transcriptional regulator
MGGGEIGFTYGHERELAMAEDLLQAAAAGRVTVLGVVGEAGIGKTTVWRGIVERAETRGWLVLSCRPDEGDATLALSAVADLLESAPSEALAVEARSRLGVLVSGLVGSNVKDGSPDLRTVAAGVRSLLVELSSTDQPLLIAVDDVQWLDPASASVIGFTLRRINGGRLAWLFTASPDARAVLDYERLADSQHVKRLELGPLSPAALQYVIEGQLEEPLTRPVLVQAHLLSGGNPALAVEIARELSRQRRMNVHIPPVKNDLHDLLTQRVRQLPAATREALLLVSVMTDPSVAFIDEAAMAAAEEAELVRIDDHGAITFRHPLVSSVVYGAAPWASRRRLHSQLAETASDPEARARHLAAATTRPDECVAQLLEEAAELARARGAWEVSAELLDRARTLTPADFVEAARHRGIRAAEHYAHAGDRPRARAVLEEILAAEFSGPQRADALRVLGQICCHDESSAEANRLLEHALEYAGDVRLAAEIELLLAFTSTIASSRGLDFGASSAHASKALTLAEASGDEGLLAEALAHVVLYDYLSGRGVDWVRLQHSLELEDRTRIVPVQSRPCGIDAFVRMCVGQHDEARQRLSSLGAWLTERGDESDLAFTLLCSSWLETRCGNLGTAAALAEEAVASARLTGSGSMAVWARMQQAYVDAHRGEVDATRQAVAESVALGERFGNALLELWTSSALVLIEVSAGNARAAWDACEPLVAGLVRDGIGEPVPAFFLPDALEALTGLGEVDRAEALVTALECRGRELERSWALATGARCRALLLAAQGDLAGALAAVETALAEHEQCDLPFDHARALLVKGAIERRMRRRAKARTSFEQALERFERIGARLWAERARQELDRLRLRRNAGEQLTETEQRVAELTAQGLTRREVAAILFVSPKTVDATVTRVYRKLAVRTRAELGAYMARPPKK